MKIYLKILTTCLFALLLVSCTTIKTSNNIQISSQNRIAILPFTNNTETVQAHTRAVSMVSHLIQTKGGAVSIYPYKQNCQQLLNCQNPNKVERKALYWAKNKHIPLVLTGSVNEWRYKVGLDGEPSVSLTLRLVDMKHKRVLWSAVGSKIGGSRSGLGGIAQQLITEMLEHVRIS